MLPAGAEVPSATLRNRPLAAAAVALLAGALAEPALAQRSATEEAVRIVFTSFKHATQNKEGKLAARLVDDETAGFFEKVRAAALRMDKPELLKQPLFFQISVISTRHYFKRADIERVTGRDLYGKYVEIGDPGAAKAFQVLTITKVTPERNGLSALADLEYEGKPADFQLRFFIHQGNWRVDLWRLMRQAVTELENKIGITPRTPLAVIEEVLGRDMLPALAIQSGRPVTAAVWTPLVK